MQTRIPAWFPLWCIAILAMSAIAVGRLAAAEPRPTKPSAEPAKGILKIEGTGIEQLILIENRDVEKYDPINSLVLEKPATTLTLPAGKYIFGGADLKGGYSCEPPLTQGGTPKLAAELLTILADKPCTLEIGAPLKQVLTSYRQGRTLHLSCQIVDASGNSYTRTKRDNPPRFTVFCNGREVGSGTFEYG